jgi:hypothetical protein
MIASREVHSAMEKMIARAATIVLAEGSCDAKLYPADVMVAWGYCTCHDKPGTTDPKEVREVGVVAEGRERALEGSRS